MNEVLLHHLDNHKREVKNIKDFYLHGYDLTFSACEKSYFLIIFLNCNINRLSFTFTGRVFIEMKIPVSIIGIRCKMWSPDLASPINWYMIA